MRNVTRLFTSLGIASAALVANASLTQNWSLAFTPFAAETSAWTQGVVNPGDNSVTLIGTLKSVNEQFVALRNMLVRMVDPLRH